MSKWFYKSWWDYVINGGDYSKGSEKAGFSWTAFFCRIKGHEGVVWFNIIGLELDTHCSNCGDDLG